MVEYNEDKCLHKLGDLPLIINSAVIPSIPGELFRLSLAIHLAIISGVMTWGMTELLSSAY